MVIHVAHGLEEAKSMKREGKEPIVVRVNEHEVYVFSRSEEIAQIMWDGAWSMSEPDGEYEKFIFTGLDEHQVVEHLSELAKLMGRGTSIRRPTE